MTTSFLLVADPAGTRRHDLAARLAPQAGWANEARTVEVLTWAEHGWPADNLAVDAVGVVAWGGWPVPLAEGGRSAAIADGLRLAAGRPTPDRWDRLRGTWGAAVLDGTGRGLAFGDPLGLRPLYLGGRDGAVVVGTDPHRVALACTAARPARDPMVAALGASTVRAPRRSGYLGVGLLDPGTSVRVAGDGSTAIDEPGPPWLELGALEGATSTELLDVVRGELRSGLETVLALGLPTVELTGGKDSRLVLAAAIDAGVAAQLPFETVGPPGLPDVEVAERIAAEHGLTHRRAFERPATDPLPYPELFARFVERTAGMVTGWEARPLLGRTGSLRVSGLNGEALRTHHRIEPTWTPAQLARSLDAAIPSSSLGLARPELEERRTAGFDEQLAWVRARTEDPHDLVDSFLLAVQTRQQYGPLDALQPNVRFLPLSSLRAIRAAFALGGRARHAELIHFSIIHAVSPDLAATPFAGDRWPADLAELVDVDLPELAAIGRPQRRTAGRLERPGRKAGAKRSLMASLHQHLSPERRATLEEHLGDPTNPVWELLDRSAALEALARYDELGPKQRKELYGAATAACWMAG